MKGNRLVILVGVGCIGLFVLLFITLDGQYGSKMIEEVYYFRNTYAGYSTVLRLNGEPVARSGWKTSGEYVTPLVKDGNNEGSITIKVPDDFGGGWFGRSIRSDFVMFDEYGWVGEPKKVISRIDIKEAKKKKYKKTFSFTADIPYQQRWRDGADLSEFSKKELRTNVLKKYKTLYRLIKQNEWDRVRQFMVSPWKHPPVKVPGLKKKLFQNPEARISKIENYVVQKTPVDRLKLYYGKKLMLLSKKKSESDPSPHILFAGAKEGEKTNEQDRWYFKARALLCFIENGKVKVLHGIPMAKSNSKK